MPRGQKICPKCNTATGPRSFACKSCGHEFRIQKGVTKINQGVKGKPIDDWRNLQKDDYIRVIAGSGPYHETEKGREPMGYSGTFRVKFRDNEGIGAYPADKKNSGFCYIYMGCSRPSKISGMLEPHRICKIDPKYMRKK